MKTKKKLLAAFILALTFIFSAAGTTPLLPQQTGTVTVAYAKPRHRSSYRKQTKKKSRMVWITATGSKYHSTNHCGRTNPNTATKETEAQARAQGYGPCKKCFR